MHGRLQWWRTLMTVWWVLRTLIRRQLLVWCRVLILRRRRQAAVCWRRRPLGLLVLRAHWVLTRGTGLAGMLHGRLRLLRRHALSLIIRINGLRRHLRVLHFSETSATPVLTCCKWRWCRAWRRRVLGVCSPLWSWWATKGTWLVRLRVHILRERRTSLVGQTSRGLPFEQRQASLDVYI